MKMKIKIPNKTESLLFAISFLLLLQIVPYDIFKNYGCVNDLANGQLYETLNCRRPVFSYLLMHVLVSLFGALAVNAAIIIYSITLLLILNEARKLINIEINILYYFAAFWYFIFLSTPNFSFVFATLFLLLAMNKNDVFGAGVFFALAMNFNMVSLLFLPLLLYQYRSIKILIAPVMLTLLILFIFPNYLQYTLMYANTFTDRNVMDESYIVTGEVQTTSIADAIMDLITTKDPDKIHYKSMLWLSIILFEPFLALFYLAFGLKDLIWFFATLPARVLIINSIFIFASRFSYNKDAKNIAIAILIMFIFGLNLHYIEKQNELAAGKIDNMYKYRMLNKFIKNFDFNGAVLSDDILIQQKFYEQNNGFQSYVETSEWCEILIHKYGEFLGYDNCDIARYETYILPRAQEIYDGKYDLIVISSAFTDSYIYTSARIVPNIGDYCSIVVPSLHDSCMGCRQFMLFLFKDRNDCVDFGNEMNHYLMSNGLAR